MEKGEKFGHGWAISAALVSHQGEHPIRYSRLYCFVPDESESPKEADVRGNSS
jgi:hypothetical protein